MNPDDFYPVAHLLADHVGGTSEPFVRSAVSRYYYGAFHEARAFLEARHCDLRRSPEGDDRAGSHQIVSQWLRKERNEDASEALDELRERRTWADYRLSEKAHQNEIDEVRSRLRDLRTALGH